MRRREFIGFLTGAAALPFAAYAQQGERIRRIGALMPHVAQNPQVHARNAAFLEGLRELGWEVGRNVVIEYRWGSAGAPGEVSKQAAELVALAPDVILAGGSAALRPLLQVNAQHTHCLRDRP